MNTYAVNFTNVTTSPISVDEQAVDNTSTDISLFGYIRLQYGEELQENLLHLLENYASPEDPSNPGNPEFSSITGNRLENPVVGQFWYNSTTKILNRWIGDRWSPMRTTDDTAANWGSIAHGQQLPLPVSPVTGRVFDYDECIWSVSPTLYENYFINMSCGTHQEDSTVTMEYEFADSTVIQGTVNYLIIGMRGNKNLGSSPVIEPGVTPTITPTQNITPTVTATVTPTPTITPTVTPVASYDIIGVDTRLYTAPSPGDPGGAGSGGVDTRLYDTCTIPENPAARYHNVQYTDVQQSYYVSLQNIMGGVPPYTVSFRWVNVHPISGWWNDDGDHFAKFDIAPWMTMSVEYYGGTGTTSDWLRTGVDGTMVPRIQVTPTFNDPDWFNKLYAYYIAYELSGYIILTDAVGASQQWHLPQYPTEIGGSNIHDAVTWVHPVSYGHYPDCYTCPGCR